MQWTEEEKKEHCAIAKRNWSLWINLQRQNTQFPALPTWPRECHNWEFKNLQPQPTMSNIDLTVPVSSSLPDAVAVPMTHSGSKRKITPPFAAVKMPTPGPSGFLASRFGLSKSPERLSG